MNRRSFSHSWPRSWLATVALFIILLILIRVGWWQSTGVGPQVQVPMFYDAHYSFPRPWTQAQEVPGIPNPLPVAALYGSNHLSQPFISGANQLAGLKVWLAGPQDTTVQASLSSEGGDVVLSGEIYLTKGKNGAYYWVTFPPIPNSRGQKYWLTLAAPLAIIEEPVVARTIGGDRLGGAVWLNEYIRPGNLELYTYAHGLPGKWWLEAIGEQLLPNLFRLRVQQYKPAFLKGLLFPSLLVVTTVLTLALLLLSSPSPGPYIKNAGWGVAMALAGFLFWQTIGGKVYFPFGQQINSLETGSEALALTIFEPESPQLVNDLTLLLWTAKREPEERFIKTDSFGNLPGIRVPAKSRLSYPMIVPLNGYLRMGLAVAGKGKIQFTVIFGGQEILVETITSSAHTNPLAEKPDHIWKVVDLSPWAGQTGFLELITKPIEGMPQALWLTPQIQAKSSWLHAYPLAEEADMEKAGYRFGPDVMLLSYSLWPQNPQPGDILTVRLFWHSVHPPQKQATVFVHLLDEKGNLLAQHDAQPVANTYPLTSWQSNMVIEDAHELNIPYNVVPDSYQLAVGLYDPVTLLRWPVTDLRGRMPEDARALLPFFAVSEPAS